MHWSITINETHCVACFEIGTTTVGDFIDVRSSTVKSLFKLDSYSDTTLLNVKKFTKHITDYLGLYASMLRSKNIRFHEALILPNLHLINFLFFIRGRMDEKNLQKKS